VLILAGCRRWAKPGDERLVLECPASCRFAMAGGCVSSLKPGGRKAAGQWRVPRSNRGTLLLRMGPIIRAPAANPPMCAHQATGPVSVWVAW